MGQKLILHSLCTSSSMYFPTSPSRALGSSLFKCFGVKDWPLGLALRKITNILIVSDVPRVGRKGMGLTTVLKRADYRCSSSPWKSNLYQHTDRRSITSRTVAGLNLPRRRGYTGCCYGYYLDILICSESGTQGLQTPWFLRYNVSRYAR